MLHRTLIAGLALFAATAQAQEVPLPLPPAMSPLLAPLAGLPGLPGKDVLVFVSNELGGRGVVKGAPYTATAVSETRQTLADGNRIVRSTTSRLYRDSQGRTRQEQGRSVVFVNDVVAGKQFLLNTDRKNARELPAARMHAAPPAPPMPPAAGALPPQAPPSPPALTSGEQARTWAEAMRLWVRDFTWHKRGDPATVEREVIVRKGDAGSAPPEIVSERVEVIRLGEAGRAPLPPLPPGVPMLAPPGPGTSTALGSRDFDGVRADGTKTIWTIPAGQIGNEKPIEIVTERWYAPDLMLVVYSSHADPRSGERTYRLEGIKRDEPPVDLFKVPADYEMRGASAAKPEGK